MAENYGNRYTEKQLAILERKLKMVYSESKADLDDAVDRYYNGYTEIVNGKLVHHPGMYDRLKTELEAYERGEYTQEEFTKWWWSQEGRGQHIEAMRDEMARAMTETNMRAAALINDNTPGIYAMNANWTAYTIAVPRQDKDGNWTKDVTDGVAFNLVNEQTVRELIHDDNNHVEFRVNRVNRKSDYEWNKDQITKALLSGILQGESVYKIADRFMIVQKRNTAAAIRNARTSFTSAQNAGSLNAMEQAVKMGIKIKKQWMSTKDNRTRDRHLELNGEQQAVDKKFSNGLMYPGDAEGKPEEVYNCRCTMVTVDPAVVGVNKDPYDVAGFDEWMRKERTDLWKKKLGIGDLTGEKEEKAQEEKKQEKQKVDYSNKTAEELNREGIVMLRSHWDEYREKFLGNATPFNMDDVGKGTYDYSVKIGKFKDKEKVANILKVLDNLGEKFYSPLDRLEWYDMMEAVNSTAFADVFHQWSVGSATMRLNPVKFTEKGIERLKELSMTKYCANIPEGRELEYIITHEFGHSILNLGESLPTSKKNFVQANYDPVKKARKELGSIWGVYAEDVAKTEKEYRDYSKKIDGKFLIEMIMPTEEEKKELGRRKEAFEKTRISKYSMSNSDEFVAESFADVIMNGENANYYSKQVYKVIEKYFGKG
ncbi:MAG: phage head morphogenesis protein [Dorea sp.]|nr:phage head morphogenesis protein [Dorea sp.]